MLPAVLAVSTVFGGIIFFLSGSERVKEANGLFFAPRYILYSEICHGQLLPEAVLMRTIYRKRPYIGSFEQNSGFFCSVSYYYADGSGVARGYGFQRRLFTCSFVCLSVCFSHDILKMDAARITKLDMDKFHDKY